jgi:membrane protease YdiL (CAAX protease family)
MVLVQSLNITLEQLLNETAFEVTSSLISGAAYLGAFMIPAAFFKMFCVGKQPEPKRFLVKLEGDSLAWILGGIACGFAFSVINGLFLSMINIPEAGGVINEAAVYMKDYSLVLQFITIAIVPAFCEEFLFRGVILSNLMPYGKGLAIIASSVLFGLMHGNFYQFLYTTAAGIILGTLYVVTDSIWAAILMHLVNNSWSVLQTAILERLNDPMATTVWLIVEGGIFLVGIVCIVYLVIKYSDKESIKKLQNVGIVRGLESSEAVKGFFCPTVVMFILYAVFEAVTRLIYTWIGS